jgi:hypothetical protein
MVSIHINKSQGGAGVVCEAEHVTYHIMAPIDIASWLLKQRTAMYVLPGKKVLHITEGPGDFVCTFRTTRGLWTMNSSGQIAKSVIDYDEDDDEVVHREEAGKADDDDSRAWTVNISPEFNLITRPGNCLSIVHTTPPYTLVLKTETLVPSYITLLYGNKLFSVNDTWTVMSVYDFDKESKQLLHTLA